MILFHGSTVIVDSPEIRKSEAFLDFGQGFYTTTSYEQAERWARIKLRRLNETQGFVSVYTFDYDRAMLESDIFRFETADMEWLEFVVRNRRGEVPQAPRDMYIGPVADDNVYRSVRLFETGVLDADETVKRLKTEMLRDQWVFCSDKMLSYLSFVEAHPVRREA